MEDLDYSDNFVCVDGKPCRNFEAGHHTHWIHRGAADRSSDPYQDAIVRAVDGHEVVVEFPDGSSETYWNHEDLAAVLTAGNAVSVHSKHHLLVVGDVALNVASPADS